MKYSELISIKENFKSSINIEYDLLNFDKLSEYIPTEDACDIFKYYFNNIISRVLYPNLYFPYFL